jgi:acetyl-CoA carboxylase carboxyltransferase component
MAPQSGHADGPEEIAKLLELLNAYEPREETATHVAQVLNEQAQDEQAQDEQVRDEHEAPIPVAMQRVSSNPVARPNDPSDEVENRFAAHIVQGMSKLRG